MPEDPSNTPPNATPEAGPAPGDVIAGKYVVESVLGVGGMGIVVSARHLHLNQSVAIKLLQAKAGSVGSTAGGQAWLQREAQAQAKLAHPNVLAVYDVGTLADDRVFVAMELVEGETLRAWLDRADRSWQAVIDVVHHLAPIR